MEFFKKNKFNFIFIILAVFLVTILFNENENYSDGSGFLNKEKVEDNKNIDIVENTEKTEPIEPTEVTEATEITKVTEPVKNNESQEKFSAAQIQNIISGKEEYSGDKMVFLTFDDGPFNDQTNDILNILKENNIKATFFLQGRNINDTTGETLKRIVTEGSIVASHSYSHDYSFLYPGRVGNSTNIINEFLQYESLVKKYLGEDFATYTWRYPGGHMSWKELGEADAKLLEHGVEWVDWNTMNRDAEPASRRPTTPEGQLEAIISGLEWSPTKEVVVVLMHDGKDITVESLPMIINYFKENGFKFAVFN